MGERELRPFAIGRAKLPAQYGSKTATSQHLPSTDASDSMIGLGVFLAV